MDFQARTYLLTAHYNQTSGSEGRDLLLILWGINNFNALNHIGDSLPYRRGKGACHVDRKSVKTTRDPLRSNWLLKRRCINV